jgi:hypothetical protein
MNCRSISITCTVIVLLFIRGNIATAQSPPVAATYQLNQQSAFERGCFPPCYCALFGASLQGTFVLTPAGDNGLFQTYTVTDVNWIILQGKQQLLVTGSGTYETGGEVAVEQRLELDLQVGDQPVQHFDSGLVAAGAVFPDISVTISVNGMMHCFDTVFMVSASPAPSDAIHPYRLKSGSALQSACRPPCACAAVLREPLSGSFGLMDLPPTAQLKQFAVVDANWTASPAKGGMPASMHGTGLYQLSGRGMAAKQRLILEMTSGDGTSTRFDSGLVRSGATFPLITVKTSSNGKRCASTVIAISAAPN